MVARDLVHVTADGDLRPGAGPRGAHRLWPYTQGWRWLRRRREEHLVDPVNLYIVGGDVPAVLAALAGAGWTPEPDGGRQRTWLDGRLRMMRSHAALGPPELRHHVRLWPFAGGVVAAAHHERLDDQGHHQVLSWDAARARVADDLCARGYERLAPSPVVTRPDVRGLPSDGRVWRLAAPGVAHA
jgi:hypothetical protein